MRYGITALTVLIILSSSQASSAQTYATTESGGRLLLNDDGTWEAVTESAGDGVAGIRGVQWGMSRDAVKKVEDRTPKDDYADLVTYRVRVAGLPTVIGYSFDNDQLVAARYSVQDTYTNKTQYITDYDNLKTLLKTKYGVPSRDEQVWRNVQFKSNPRQWGAAVQLGHLSYVTEWLTDTKGISLQLTWAGNALDFYIRYYNPRLTTSKVDDTPEKQALSDL